MSLQYLEKLKSLMPPPDHPPLNEANWPVAEEVLGLRLPHDFREIVHIYGNAIWCDSFRPVYPGTTLEECQEYRDHLLELLKPMDFLYDEERTFSYARYPDPGGLLPCLIDFDGGACCWITEGAPDNWGILYWFGGPCKVFPMHNVSRLICDWIEQKPPVQDVWDPQRLAPGRFKLTW